MRVLNFLIFIFAFYFANVFAEIDDIKNLPQDPGVYVELDRKLLISQDVANNNYKKFMEKYFSPWEEDESCGIKREELFYSLKNHPLYEFNNRPNSALYAENKQPHDVDWINKLEKLSDLTTCSNQNRAAIVIRGTNVRRFPTHKPAFFDFQLAGEGFPFDNFQGAFIFAGTPIFVYHTSRDGKWSLVKFSPNVIGWVLTSDIAFVDKAFMESYRKNSFVAFTKDYVPVNDNNGKYRFDGRIGAILPLIEEKQDEFIVGIPVADINRNAVLLNPHIKRENMTIMPMMATNENLVSIARQLIGEKYGWCGYLGNRDCSSMIKDFFTPFGIWLPKYSAGQKEMGRSISLEGLTPDEKEDVILKQGVSLLSLIWWPGHIVVYMGEYVGRPLIFHNAWGLKTIDPKTQKPGRKIIGKAVITTLEPGKEIPEVDQTRSFINRAQELILLNQ